MTRSTVAWHNTAARLWLASSDKQAVSDAANGIDRELAIDPDTKGGIVRNQLRQLAVPPLKVLYLGKRIRSDREGSGC